MLYELTYQNGEFQSDVNVSCCKYTANKARGFPRHCHPFFEIDYSIKGLRTVFINEKKVELPERSLFFVPVLAIHTTTNKQVHTENIIIQFSRELLYYNSKTLSKKANLVLSGKLLERCYIMPEEHEMINYYLQQLIDISPLHNVSDYDVENRILYNKGKMIYKNNFKIEQQDFHVDYNPHLEWKLNSLVLGLLGSLLDEGYLQIEECIGNEKDAVQIQQLLNILLTHPDKRFTLEEAAEISGMSYGHFSRVFKQMVGLNYVDYCNVIRIRYAEELLTNTDKSVTEISEVLNFGSINYFNRVFKEHNGYTPNQYRKMANS